QNRKLVGDWNKRRPAIERPPADIQRKLKNVRDLFHRETAHPSDDAADQHDQRHAVLVKPERFVQPFHRDGAEAVDFSVTVGVDFFRAAHNGFGGLEFGQESIVRKMSLGVGAHACAFSFSWSIISRLSKMEIIGMKRMKIHISMTNSPIVPKNVHKSHRVGTYMPHEDGKKSRCKLVATIIKRSSHMPTLTTSAIAHTVQV